MVDLMVDLMEFNAYVTVSLPDSFDDLEEINELVEQYDDDVYFIVDECLTLDGSFYAVRVVECIESGSFEKCSKAIEGINGMNTETHIELAT